MGVPELGSIFYHTSRPVKGRFGPYVQALSIVQAHEAFRFTRIPRRLHARSGVTNSELEITRTYLLVTTTILLLVVNMSYETE